MTALVFAVSANFFRALGTKPALGREFTVPGVAQTVILTRTAERATAMPPGEDLATLGAGGSDA